MADLGIGAQIEFPGPIFNDYGSEINHPRAVVIKHVKDWLYICRFQEEVWPRDRKVSSSQNSQHEYKLILYLP